MPVFTKHSMQRTIDTLVVLLVHEWDPLLAKSDEEKKLILADWHEWQNTL